MLTMFLSIGSSLTVLLGLWFTEWRNRKMYVAYAKGAELSPSRTRRRVAILL